MQKRNIYEIEGIEFPAGRRTRVMIGLNGAVKGDKICQGFVVLNKNGGYIPEHEHENVESYTILRGEGEITVNGETEHVKEGDFVFIPSGAKHSLTNTGSEDMNMMFVYSPNTIVDHWSQEKSGELH